MADLACSICLEPYKSPVSIPCGHIHCERCLLGHINAGPNFTRSFCPTCRAPFNIVSPDFRYLPARFHEFVLPSIRKVYIDTTSNVNLKKQISQLEARMQVLKGDNARLSKVSKDKISLIMKRLEAEVATRLESGMAADKNHDTRAAREAEVARNDAKLARQQAQTAMTRAEESDRVAMAAKRELEETRRKYETMKRKYEMLKKERGA